MNEQHAGDVAPGEQLDQEPLFFAWPLELAVSGPDVCARGGLVEQVVVLAARVAFRVLRAASAPSQLGVTPWLGERGHGVDDEGAKWHRRSAMSAALVPIGVRIFSPMEHPA
jgi:hypothetical protein